jgi:2-hydroxychromene-2-carboxylate isomerase
MQEFEFYYDFLSPYSYLGFQWLKKNKLLLETLKYRVVFRPVVLGQIIKSYDTKGPAEIPTKRNFLFKDCLRYSKLNNIPFTTPKTLPFNSLYVLRMSLALKGEEQFRFIDEVFKAGWASGEEIGEPEDLEKLLISLDFNKNLLDAASDKEFRKELKMNNKMALEKGVFGLPAFYVNNELFWGNDSTKYLEYFIKGEDLLDKEKYQNFLDKHPFS